MNKQSIRIFAGSSSMNYAQEIWKVVWVEISRSEIKKFSCWETYVRLLDSVRWKEVFIVHTIRAWNVNDDLVELFLLIDAAKQSFAKTIHVISPHLAYSRQDKIHAPREWISAKLVAKLLETSWADEVITVNLHSDQHQWFFNIPVDNLNLINLFVDEINKLWIENPVVVSPDAGWAKSAKKFADKIWANLAFLHKTRPEHNVSYVTNVVGDVKWRTPILFDDMIDTAWSVCWAKNALLESWSNEDVYLFATHPIFSGPAIERLKSAKFKKIVVADTIPLSADMKLPEIEQISTANLVAKVIVSIIERKSVSSLY